MAVKKKEGLIHQLRRESREDKQKFTDSVTVSKDYDTLYDIGSAIRGLDTASLMIGAGGIVIGLLLWVFTVLVPFLRTFTFHMGFGGATGITLILCGLSFYFGSARILRPLSKAVNVAKDRVIREILAEKEGDE